MKISQLLSKGSIIVNLEAHDKKGAIDELALAVSKATKAPVREIAAVLMEREQLGSTGIGGGIAIPHGKLDSVRSIIVGFGLSRKGVEYESLDNKPVHIFFLLLTPENSTGGHLKVLAQISKLLKRDQFKKGLIAAESVDEIYNIIKDQDEDF
ncbi:MAG: PTS sugar transporter subunit IIA [Desulfobacula sp.]|jgi:nitrogen PTS system EIIA component|uniref:PTS sugar transporter subunit IIA n=1 Tax=Desulfobacula sp. TaxID=2593537 RepID=UPI001D7850FD|nr:PTS sugar transporter subunit IIA [Desulfobacula sp.]MBT3485865.1 PTS sugar transporter subunit IIA [Desulfobacula sp.]MBT3805468.1 PTS sugar transporter subunit IIA [Desulfobacula sp.]MBT4026817.1 PTS sugar transporter subunit IIA [Desulfobacula sp.]MBT4199579.1 PTS sugar transporter subunit IIA [Desulfobacula sp.]